MIAAENKTNMTEIMAIAGKSIAGNPPMQHSSGIKAYGKTILTEILEPRHEKTNVLHMRKQRRRSASR